ncbi:MAG: hypothetical protein HN350_20835, partial [Phycisphaerales bacterium]|nr:hypothetical protein [Phycisphaerales bacterium]
MRCLPLLQRTVGALPALGCLALVAAVLLATAGSASAVPVIDEDFESYTGTPGTQGAPWHYTVDGVTISGDQSPIGDSGDDQGVNMSDVGTVAGGDAANNPYLVNVFDDITADPIYIQFDFVYDTDVQKPAFRVEGNTFDGTNIAHNLGINMMLAKNNHPWYKGDAATTLSDTTMTPGDWYRYTLTIDAADSAVDSWGLRVQSLDSTTIDDTYSGLTFQNQLTSFDAIKFYYNSVKDATDPDYAIDNVLVTTDEGDLNFDVLPAMMWRTDDSTGLWAGANWTTDDGANWVEPAADKYMVVNSGTATVSTDVSGTAAQSLAIALDSVGGTVMINSGASLAVTDGVTVGDGGRLEVNGLLTTDNVDVVNVAFGGTLAMGGGGQVTSSATSSGGTVALTVAGTLAGGDDVAVIGDYDEVGYTSLTLTATSTYDVIFNDSDTSIDVNGMITMETGATINLIDPGSLLEDGDTVKLFRSYLDQFDIGGADDTEVLTSAGINITMPTGWTSDDVELAWITEEDPDLDDEEFAYLVLQITSTGGGPQLGDATGDGKVNEADMAILLAQFGSPYDMAREPNNADFNGDGFVDMEDFVMLRANWGEGTAPDASELP